MKPETEKFEVWLYPNDEKIPNKCLATFYREGAAKLFSKGTISQSGIVKIFKVTTTREEIL